MKNIMHLKNKIQSATKDKFKLKCYNYRQNTHLVPEGPETEKVCSHLTVLLLASVLKSQVLAAYTMKKWIVNSESTKT